jgi:hypothetical protein
MATSESGPRTLTQMLREWDDDSLTRLLHARPELAFPTPAAFSELAARATTRHAVRDALDRLNAVELAVAHAASVLDAPFTTTDIVSWFGANPGSDEEAAVEGAVVRLRSYALLWGSDAALRPVRVLVNAMEAMDEASTGDDDTRLTSLAPPDFATASRQRATLVDNAAAGSAFEFVRQLEVLVEHSDHQPIRMTRAGRLAARDVRALGQLLDVEPAFAQSLLEFAHAAGFVGFSAHGADEVVIPTERFDEWRTDDVGSQWRALADTWLGRDLGGGPPELKALLIAAYGDPPDGRVLSVDDLRAWLRWHRPRRLAVWSRAVPGFVTQAGTVGLTGLGALASFALEPDAGSLAALLPDRVDHVLLQADLTAIAPGPLRPDVAADFAALADVESRGGATVFRFSRESLAQAMSLGWSADDIVETLRTRSRTPVPQPLEYLIRDFERDPTSRGAPTFGLRPQVGSRAGHRLPRRAGQTLPEDLTPGDRLDDAFADEIVRTLRTNDADDADGADYGNYSESLGGAPLDTMREAIETQETIWLGYVDRVGTRREQTAHLTSVDDGLVRGRDASGEPVAIPVSRILAAHIIRSSALR